MSRGIQGFKRPKESPGTPGTLRVNSQPLFPIPRASSKPLAPNVDDMGVMLVDSPDLWQSEAFLEDLQAGGWGTQRLHNSWLLLHVIPILENLLQDMFGSE